MQVYQAGDILKKLYITLPPKCNTCRVRSLQGIKQLFADIDEDGNGRMNYEEFYTFLERSNPKMLPAASSIFTTLDKHMDGQVRFKVGHTRMSPSHIHMLHL